MLTLSPLHLARYIDRKFVYINRKFFEKKSPKKKGTNSTTIHILQDHRRIAHFHILAQ
ncbi:Uncharacterised protein [Candidatus Bartonella washoeensis]|uniref:Uncharacterized protein n=2 Tax=Candidatus Bartonella washoeensis TaxID=186739 RepID=J1JHD4_9HYPH|nr:hypothetical protein MCQ_00509 [Bartonella washoeensis Sb944nv]EJF83590.1 hypothetical protein MCW_01312 [Bartonella washoeensis 085-0475]SPU27647.1 Uncharacterised protein [Bartonella washoeensis]